jgi:hypothetical protein
MKTLLIGTCLAAGLLSGCAAAASPATGGPAAKGPATQSQTAAGRLTVRMIMEGGPMGADGKQPGPRPISGTVTITAAGRSPVTVAVGSSGTRSVPLPPGRYQVTGRSPALMTVDDQGHSREDPFSPPASAIVTAGHTATVTLGAIVP